MGDGRMLESSDGAGLDPDRAAEDEYGAGKLRAERAIRASRPDAVILRLPDVLGPHENTGRLRRLLHRLATGRRVGSAILGSMFDALPGGEAGGDAGGGPGGGGEREAAAGSPHRLGLVFAADVASAVVAALAAPTPARARSPLHVCCREAPTWEELVGDFAEALRALGVECPPVRFDATLDTSFVSVDVGPLSMSAATAELGWAPAPLRGRLVECVEWWYASMMAEFERDRAAPTPPLASDGAPAAGAPEEAGEGAPPERNARDAAGGRAGDQLQAALRARRLRREERKRGRLDPEPT